MKQTAEIAKAPLPLRLALAVGLSLLGGRPAAARPLPNARAVGLDPPLADLKPPAAAAAPATSANAASPARSAKPAPDPGIQRAKMPSSCMSDNTDVTGTVVIMDNYSIDYFNSKVQGPGAPPKIAQSCVTVPAPGVAGCPLLSYTLSTPVLVNGRKITNYTFYFLPFSSGDFPPADTHPVSKLPYAGYGLYLAEKADPISGSLPQSSLPLGVPVAPDSPAFDVAQVREAVVKLVSLLDTPDAAKSPAARLLQAAMHDRDVREADTALPKPSLGRPKPQG
jgi:hypothetical protein